MPESGFKICKPTSVAVTGTGAAATIQTFGRVGFSSCTTLSLNGVFSSAYENYMIVMQGSTTSGLAYAIRLRASGSDNSTASSYVYQYLFATDTSISGAKTTSSFSAFLVGTNQLRNGGVAYIFGPNLTQPTAIRTLNSYSTDGARFYDIAATHNQSTSYDGFTLFHQDSATMTGSITVYGCNQ